MTAAIAGGADAANPCGVRGLAFLALAAPDPGPIHQLLIAFGFSRTMRHHRRDVDVYQQGAIRLLLDRSCSGFAAGFTAAHGPCIHAMALAVDDAEAAARTAIARGATARPGELSTPDGRPVPALAGIGGSLIYLVERDVGELGFRPLPDPDDVPPKGFTAIDHLTHNVPRGELARWATFYRQVFGFTEVRYFDIRGVKTGLQSFALRSPCGTFCIPINEGSETGSQIDEYLEQYRGPGIQHVALLTDDILGSLRALDGATDRAPGGRGGVEIAFLDIDDDYYRDVFARVPNVREDHAELARRAVLVDGDADGYLLQIFTRTVIGPIFIELIQRRNHRSFGEGNFGALFRSIERDQQRRGYLR